MRVGAGTVAAPGGDTFGHTPAASFAKFCVVAAAKDLQLKVPVVIRMEGTNVEQGQKILRESGLNFTIADGMKDGATKVVRLAG